MISNYYTLYAVARSIHLSQSGWVVGTPFTQRRNELVIPLGSVDADQTLSLVASCEPAANFLVAKTTSGRANKNSADIFPLVQGSSVRSCDIHPTDRIVSLSLSTDHTLLFCFFGSRANVFCIAPSGSTVDSFLRSRKNSDLTGYPFPAPEARSLEGIVHSAGDEIRGLSIERMIRRSYPMLGPVLTRELLFRSSIDGSTTVGDLPDSTMRSLSRSHALLVEELIERPSPRIIIRDGNPVFFSLIPLHNLGEVEEDPQSSISRGILRYLSSQKRQDSFLSRKKMFIGAIETDVEKSTRAGDAVARSILDEGEIALLERFGKILHMHLSSLTKGMTSFEVHDPFEQTDIMRTIRLEPALSPIRNAERYFEKAKSARNRIQDSEKRKREIDRRVKVLQTMLTELDEISDTDGLLAFAERHRDEVSLPGSSGVGGTPQQHLPPFRVYTVHGGFAVWVGKNSANNDLLTTRHTGKNDLWFHARGVGGSHVVLKTGSGKGEVPRQAIQAAASIAAWYSKMKNARHVPVSMCLGKFVRKPRKAPAGTVTIEREEVLFADPALPAEK